MDFDWTGSFQLNPFHTLPGAHGFLSVGCCMCNCMYVSCASRGAAPQRCMCRVLPCCSPAASLRSRSPVGQSRARVAAGSVVSVRADLGHGPLLRCWCVPLTPDPRLTPPDPAARWHGHTHLICSRHARCVSLTCTSCLSRVVMCSFSL